MAALSGSKSRSRGGPELKNRKLKEQAIAFYNEHDVPAKLEHLLNQLFPSPPPDLYGYMVLAYSRASCANYLFVSTQNLKCIPGGAE